MCFPGYLMQGHINYCKVNGMTEKAKALQDSINRQNYENAEQCRSCRNYRFDPGPLANCLLILSSWLNWGSIPSLQGRWLKIFENESDGKISASIWSTIDKDCFEQIQQIAASRIFFQEEGSATSLAACSPEEKKNVMKIVGSNKGYDFIIRYFNSEEKYEHIESLTIRKKSDASAAAVLQLRMSIF